MKKWRIYLLCGSPTCHEAFDGMPMGDSSYDSWLVHSRGRFQDHNEAVSEFRRLKLERDALNVGWLYYLQRSDDNGVTWKTVQSG